MLNDLQGEKIATQNPGLRVQVGGINVVSRRGIALEQHHHRIRLVDGDTAGGFINPSAAQGSDRHHPENHSQARQNHPAPLQQDTEIIPQNRFLGMEGRPRGRAISVAWKSAGIEGGISRIIWPLTCNEGPESIKAPKRAGFQRRGAGVKTLWLTRLTLFVSPTQPRTR